ncbi:hypothetical protein ACIA5G_42495 [Amycolatopsis sp. NPDC051758]|uniref:hypothetical protein n=1 Tax=Amycolatopsis sp. NPDC051758 TaxID=3363935 RepID=UPI0037BC99E0
MTNTEIATRTSTAALLWVVLAVSSAVNAGGPLVGLDFTIRMVAGGVAIAAIAGLITFYVRRRKA